MFLGSSFSWLCVRYCFLQPIASVHKLHSLNCLLHPSIVVPPRYDRRSVDIQFEVPLLARRPTPAVVHNRAVEFGTVSDEKKAFGAVSLINKGSRKATFSVNWDKTLPLIFSPSEVNIIDKGGPAKTISYLVVMLQYFVKFSTSNMC